MNAPGERIHRIGHGRFDPLSGALTLGERTVRLRPRTAALLGYLLQHGGRVVAKDELLQAIWPDVVVTEDSLVQCVKEIRQALGPAGRDWIRTVPRQGYAYVGEPAPLPPGHDELAVDAAAQRPSLRAAQWRWRSVAAVFAVVLLAAAGAAAWRWWQPTAGARAAPPLSIVVMPIANATGNVEQDNAADDLTDALTDALARTAGTTVISSGTAFTFKGKPVDARKAGSELNVRYVLEGSLRLDAGQPVLTMRLADAASAVQLWNQEFRADSGTNLHDLVVGRVSGTLGFHMVRAETATAIEHAPPPAIAGLLTQARAVVRRSGEEAPQALRLLQTALRPGDDENAEGLAMLATAYVWSARLSFTRERDLQQAQRAIERALALAPDNDKVRVAEGRVYGEAGNQPRALAAYERALALNPNNAAAHGGRGDALVMLGRAAEALAPIEHAMRISPYDPKFFVWQTYAGVAHLHLAHDAKAVELFTKVAREHPQQPFFHLFLAGALGASGRIPEAREEMKQFLLMRPGMTLAQFRALEPTDAPAFFRQRQHLYDGLLAAGMPP